MSAKDRFQTGSLRVFTAVLRAVPERAAFGLSEALALGIHRIGGWRLASTRARLAEVFPGLSEGERDRIRLEAVRNLARNAAELIRGPERFRGHMEGVEATLERIHAAREAGRGVIVVIVHSGNWDLAGIRVAREGLPVCFIARAQKNRTLYDALMRARESGGGEVVDRDDPRLISKLVSFLKRNGVVAILVDTRSRTNPGSTFRFLGRPAPVANGLGLLARRSGAAVLPVHVARVGRNRHVWKSFPERELDPDLPRAEGRRRLLQSCLDELGAEVLEHPESYFWFNKRWVLEPFADETE